MALLAHLKFGDNGNERYEKDYLLLSAKCRYSREYSGTRPRSAIRGIFFTVEVVAPGSVDLDLYAWYIDDDNREGCIVMEESSSTESTSARTIKFENARCISINEKYDISEHSKRKLLIEFSATGASTEGLDISCQKRIL